MNRGLDGQMVGGLENRKNSSISPYGSYIFSLLFTYVCFIPAKHLSIQTSKHLLAVR